MGGPGASIPVGLGSAITETRWPVFPQAVPFQRGGNPANPIIAVPLQVPVATQVTGYVASPLNFKIVRIG